MRRIALAASVLFALGSAAFAGAPDGPSAPGQYRWAGDLTFTYKTAACTWNMVGDHLVTRFRPSGLGTNGQNSNLAMFYEDYALGYRVVGPFTPAWKQAQGQDIGYGFGVFPAATYVRFLTQSPAVITAATNVITATGSIYNFDWTVGCTVNFSIVVQPDRR